MISTWIADLPRERFLTEAFRRSPLARPGTAQNAIPYLNWGVVERLIAAGANMLVVRNSKLRRDEEPRSFAEAHALFRAGWSLVLRRCERHDAALARLAREFGEELEGEVSIQLYITPSGFHSFGWHYDCEDVFIAQTSGIKEYYLRQNTVNPAPRLSAMPADMHYERETSPPMAATLVTGDALYIPRGWWHAARATEDAMSISVGVLAPDAR
ncbi:MAG TPA: cupin domain-containing protein [Thermoanaerobaculia bacterium]|jgi:ribosomal protein L16 Arg81 hydroxylase